MQCYLLPYYLAPSGKKMVMMGRKNIIGYKAKGTPQTKPIVWNSAGQWVISGGGSNKTEAPEEAAMREFFEETGVDFRVPKVQQIYLKTSALIQTYTLKDAKSNEFSVTYIQVQNSKSENLLGEINKNISGKLVNDDELHEVTWITLDAAAGLLGTPKVSEVSWMQPQIDEALKSPSITKEILTKRMEDASNWFAIALDNLPR